MKNMYRIHRWLGVTLGLFLLVQSVTGACWIGPFPFGPPTRDLPPSPLADPGDLLAPLDAAKPHGPVTSVKLRLLIDRPVYELAPVAGGPPLLIDARTGDAVRVEQDQAARIAGRHVAVGAEIAEIATVGLSHEVRFADAAGTRVAVGSVTGAITRADNRWTRGRRLLISLHDWAFVKKTTGSFRLQRYGLILVSAFAVLAILSGWNLAWRRWRIKRAAKA